MKKIIYTLALLIATIAVNAQKNATPINFEGKDIYVLLNNTIKNKTVKNLSFTKDQINETTSFTDRIQLIIKNAPTNNYDAIYTRDGITIQYLKYETPKTITKANVQKHFDKDIYFLASPSSQYKVVESKSIQSAEVKIPFFNLIKKLVKEGTSKKYDAIIIGMEQIEYIKYK